MFKTILSLLLCFTLNMSQAQHWVLTEDLPGFITDMEFHEGDRYITYKSGELFRNDTLIAVYDVHDVLTEVELGLHSVIIWNGSPCVCYSGLDSTQIVQCGKDTIISVSYKVPWAFRHRGGDMLLLADSVLLVSFGSGATPDDAQDLSSARGKIIAITNSTSYIYAYGVRNTWKMDRQGKTVYLADNGQNLQEEISKVDTAGANLGWPCYEGNIEHDTVCGDTVSPVFTYDHLPGLNSIIGGKVFQKKFWWCDHYGEYGGYWDNGVNTTIPCPEYPVGMAVDGDTLYVYDYTGKIYRWEEGPLSIDTTVINEQEETREEKRLRWWKEEMYRKYGDVHYGIDGKVYNCLPQVPGMYYSFLKEQWIGVTN